MGNSNSLHKAVSTGDIDKIRLINKKTNLNILDNDGYTPLHRAIMYKRNGIVWFLIGEGADIHIQGKDGFTALHLAIIEKLDNIAEYIINTRRNLDVCNNKCSTPLHIATTMNNYNIVCKLHTAGANLNIQDNVGLTALHIAIYKNFNEIAEYIINTASINLDILSENGYTPLYTAYKFSNIVIFKMLIDKGANLDLLYDDVSILGHVLKNKRKSYLKIIVDNIKNNNYMVDSEYASLVQNLLDNIDNIDKIDNTVEQSQEEIKKEIKLDKTTSIQELQCIVCLDNKRCITFDPCHHMNTCISCSKNLDNCPECRQSIKDKIYIFIN